MPILLQSVNTSRNELLRLLDDVDLCDSEIEHHHFQFTSSLAAAHHHLVQLYKVYRRRKRLRCAVNAALAKGTVTP
jgi:uncharacterized protein YhdP